MDALRLHGCAITLVGIFAGHPSWGMSEFGKQVKVHLLHSLLNAVFYSCHNIAYSALTALCHYQENSAERGPKMGSYRFMLRVFLPPPASAIQSVTPSWLLPHWGDTAEAWRTVAITMLLMA